MFASMVVSLSVLHLARGYTTAVQQSDLTTCQPVYPKHVFYNRIPKAASTSLKTLASDRADHNGYVHVSSRVFDDRGYFEFEEEAANVQRIQAIFDENDRVLYDQHIRFLNFSRHGLQQPAYINMVREPVSRAVSTFYFARTGGHSKREKIRELLGEQADWDINECIAKQSECRWFNDRINHFNLMTRFFCGHREQCKEVDEESFLIAKENLEQNFIFVGITERFEESVRLLEAILPDFFRGSYDIVKGHDGHSKQNVNSKSGEKPNPENWAYLHNLSRFDYALYKHANELFDKRLQSCFPDLAVAAQSGNSTQRQDIDSQTISWDSV